ncbi:MAG: dTDP-glucose 4,6-dehydratase [Ramlibacter sp.]
MILVTGGAGFIGANFVLDWLSECGEPVLNVDKLTYAGNLDNLEEIQGDPRHVFVQADIGDTAAMAALLQQHRPRCVLNFAAETHVDRSIDGPDVFVSSNVMGTLSLLKAALSYWNSLAGADRQNFRFVQISTDEVFGSLAPEERAFTELSPYAPNSPYAASKAGGDHVVRAYHHTYGLPVITTHCSNNYGPRQFPEKLIPLVILRALAGEPLPVYGDGRQVRDWLHVQDHCGALRTILAGSLPGETYNIGGASEKQNLEVVTAICGLLDEFRPRADHSSYASQISHVTDRPGHDRRYAIDASKLANQLNWRPSRAFEDGLRQTVQWYLDHQHWVARVRDGSYRSAT